MPNLLPGFVFQVIKSTQNFLLLWVITIHCLKVIVVAMTMILIKLHIEISDGHISLHALDLFEFWLFPSLLDYNHAVNAMVIEERRIPQRRQEQAEAINSVLMHS